MRAKSTGADRRILWKGLSTWRRVVARKTGPWSIWNIRCPIWRWCIQILISDTSPSPMCSIIWFIYWFNWTHFSFLEISIFCLVVNIIWLVRCIRRNWKLVWFKGDIWSNSYIMSMMKSECVQVCANMMIAKNQDFNRHKLVHYRLLTWNTK